MLTSRSLGTSLDRMFAFNRPFEQALTASLSSRISAPPMDVAERDDAYLVHAELPGVNPDQVEITFEQNVLTIRGTKPDSFDAATQGELRVFAAERVHGSFERAVRLPEFVNGDRIAAKFEHGLLTVTIPKAEAAQPRRISIDTGRGNARLGGEGSAK